MRYLLGPLALALGLAASAVAAVLWALAARSPERFRLAARARLGTQTALLGAAVAAGVMVVFLVQHDFSVRYVAENGGRAVPTYYTVISLWAAREGSLLLWLLGLPAPTVWAVVPVRPPAGDLPPRA